MRFERPRGEITNFGGYAVIFFDTAGSQTFEVQKPQDCCKSAKIRRCLKNCDDYLSNICAFQACTYCFDVIMYCFIALFMSWGGAWLCRCFLVMLFNV